MGSSLKEDAPHGHLGAERRQTLVKLSTASPPSVALVESGLRLADGVEASAFTVPDARRSTGLDRAAITRHSTPSQALVTNGALTPITL